MSALSNNPPLKESWMKRDLNKKIKSALAEKHTSYVLITCDEPNHDGEMQVDMSYGGDPVIVSYLLEGAQNVIDEEAMQQL